MFLAVCMSFIAPRACDPGYRNSDPEHLSVVLKFDSMEALQDWYDSPEYQEILALRTDNSEGIITFAQD